MSLPIIDPGLPDIDRIAIFAKYESERKAQIRLTREIHRAARSITARTFNHLGEDRVDCINRKYLAPDMELIAKDEITELFNRIK
jgi:hypothetical protein